MVSDLGDLARQLDAGRAAADDREGQPRAAAGLVSLQLGRLERSEDPPANLDRVLERLEPGRGRAPFVMAEVRVAGAGRHDQGVVVDRIPFQQHAPLLEIEAANLAEHDADVALALEDSAQRGGDLAGRQRAGGHLIEQRLEEVEVAAVHERDVDARPAQRAHRLQAGEAAADHHDAVAMIGGGHSGSRPTAM